MCLREDQVTDCTDEWAAPCFDLRQFSACFSFLLTQLIKSLYFPHSTFKYKLIIPYGGI
jgi:hypothetical protein